MSNYAKQSQFQKSQIDVSFIITRDYENKSNWTLGENKPNSNPIKANFRKAKMNASLCGKKDCEKGPRGGLRKNKPNPSTWFDSFDYAQDRFAHHRSLRACPELVEGIGLLIILVSLNWLCIISFSVMVT